MKRIIGISLAVVTLALAPSVARADESDPQPLKARPPTTPPADVTPPGIDTVHLRNGSVLRGRVTEMVPGDHITVVLPGGDSRRLVWLDVDRVIVANSAIPASAAPAAAPSAAMVGPTALVRLRAPNKAILHRKPAGSTEFVTACEAPCGIQLPIGDTYKVSGSGFPTTKDFKLDAGPGGSVEVTVDGPNWGGIIGGGLLTVTGGVTMYVGLLLAAAGNGCRHGCGDEVRNTGLGALAVGAAMTGLGLLIVYPSMKTDLAQDKLGPSKDAFVRSPTWLSAAATGTEGRPLTPTFSLFEKRF